MRTMKWQADALNYLIESGGYDMVFSHIHNDDGEKHMFLAQCNGKPTGPLTPEEYEEILLNVSLQNDYYIGRFLHLLDKGWTILLVSDHGLVSSENRGNDMISGAVLIEPFRSMGYTEVLKDEQGNDLREIDWSKTKAVMTRMNMIYLNLKGRNQTGIVEPEEQFALEAEIISKLYQYRDSRTGKRSVSIALRNRDARLLGLGGPECGDIIVFHEQGYNSEHGDSLSTIYGCAHTSTSPIFAAAGAGIKEGYVTNRVVREVDIAPTVAALAGVRMPAQCEGAPAYQIFAQEF